MEQNVSIQHNFNKVYEPLNVEEKVAKNICERIASRSGNTYTKVFNGQYTSFSAIAIPERCHTIIEQPAHKYITQ